MGGGGGWAAEGRDTIHHREAQTATKGGPDCHEEQFGTLCNPINAP